MLRTDFGQTYTSWDRRLSPDIEAEVGRGIFLDTEQDHQLLPRATRGSSKATDWSIMNRSEALSLGISDQSARGLATSASFATRPAVRRPSGSTPPSPKSGKSVHYRSLSKSLSKESMGPTRSGSKKRLMTWSQHLFSSEVHTTYTLLPGGQAVKTYDDPLEWFACCPLMDPQTSPYLEKWDMVVTVALLITAIWTPYEVAFAHGSIAKMTHFVFFIDRLLDMVFIKDMGMQFMMSFPEEREGTTRWVRDRSKIITNYINGWFWCDLLAVVPFDLIVDMSSALSDEYAKDVKVVRLIRLFRLMKIGRIVKKWQAAWGVSYGQVALMKFFFITVLAVHWMSCMWGLLALQKRDEEPDARTWLNGLFISKVFSEEEKTFYAQPHCVYLISLYWAVMTLTSLGYGDIVAENLTEYCFSVFCFVASGLIWAYVIGSICGIISAMDPLLVQYQQNMDLLNIMMADNNLPEDMRRRLRYYFQETRLLQRKVNQQTVVNSLSPGLQGELAMMISQESIHRVWFLDGLHHDAVIEISKRLKPMIFASQETLALNNVSRTLFIVERGVVARNGLILGRHGVVGDDMIISSNILRATARAICVTFIEVLYFRNEQLDEVREAFPEADRRVRRAQIRWAVRRAFVLAAWHRVLLDDGTAGPRTTDYFKREVPTFAVLDTLLEWSAQASPRGSLGLEGSVAKRGAPAHRATQMLVRRASVIGMGTAGAVGQAEQRRSTNTGQRLARRNSLGSSTDLGGSGGGDGGGGGGADMAVVMSFLEQLRGDVLDSISRIETRLERVERRVNPGFLS
mmetsp:Transcript_144261/g.462023  ORF Transcript_144261/g.462023 Transcript_144261/m.462023 type:complete len:798 (+) Transcript_144261:171-2564(+)